MLERIPKIICVVNEPENKSHKKFIRKSVTVNTPCIKRFAVKIEQIFSSRVICYGDFRELREDLKIATPPDGFILFAEKVGSAWDETSEEKRRELELPKNYTSRRTTESSLFSLIGANAAIRRMALGRLIIKGKHRYLHGRILNLIEDLREAKEKSEEIKKKLEELGAVSDSIAFNGGPVSYVLKEDRVRMSFPDFKAAKFSMWADAELIETEIAKRFCFGFSPVQ